MTRRRGVLSDDDVFSREVREGMAQSIEASHVQVPIDAAERAVEAGTYALRSLKWLLSRGDGWMRWTSDRDGKVLFLKFKFTSLKYPNHYVFVSGPIWDLADLVAHLVRKCELVDAGALMPTLDRPFNHQ